jgi:hypothetical protein
MPRPVVAGLRAISARDAHDDMVRDWLFLVLRYVVSRDVRDRQAILELAEKMDTLSGERDREAFRFFRNHSKRLCTAVTKPDTPGQRQILLAHARMIGQRPLQQLFLLTCRLELREKVFQGLDTTHGRSELWKGLKKR